MSSLWGTKEMPRRALTSCSCSMSPRQRFPIKIGDAIEENKPGPGAGVVEVPGAEDVFTFNAALRQRVYFRMLEHSMGLSYQLAAGG
jgi:hypothetical protein